MSALSPEEDMLIADINVRYVPISGHRFASATVRPNQNVDEFDEASTI